MNIFTFLGVVFLSIFIVGYFLEKIRIPWVFGALLVGVGLSGFTQFYPIIQSSEMQFLSQIGQYMLLFLIGFQLNIIEIRNSGKLIIKTTFGIILAEMLVLGTALHFIFSLPWPTAFLVALSFATVGEAILLPILDRLGLIKKKLGQLILGIATFDDVFEVLIILSVVFMAPFLLNRTATTMHGDTSLAYSLYILIWLIVFSILFIKPLKRLLQKMKLSGLTIYIPVVLGCLFLFTGRISNDMNDIAVLGALFAGMFVKNILTSDAIKEFEPYLKAITYGVFAPVFLFVVGANTNFGYLLDSFWLIVCLALLANFTKIGVSYVLAGKEIGVHSSIFMGVALSIRFSTSLVILKILLDNQIITNHLYSILIGTAIVFQFVIPVVLSYLAKRWRL